MQNFPQYCIVQQRHNTDGKRKKTKRLHTTNRNCSCCHFFFIHFFKQQVSENTRIFSDGHKEHFNCFSTALSWPDIIPRNLQNFPIESGVFICSYLCREGTILNFWNLNLMSNPYVWPPDNENDWIILKCQWQLRKFREIQGYGTLVLALLQACEVVA